jgi:transcriptional regulator with AAA-type ATPase domain
MTHNLAKAPAPKANQKVPWKAEQPEAGLPSAAAAHPSITGELQTELQRRNFVRAAAIAASLGLSANELRDIQFEALWQMAVNRNAPGTKRLARQYGISRQTLKQILDERAKQLREDGHDKALAACYDAATGKYLSFEEWMNHLIERWDN